MGYCDSLTYSYQIGVQTGKPIDIQLIHDDVPTLEAAAERLAKEIGSYSGLRDIDSGVTRGKEQMDFRLTDAAQAQGLTEFELGRQVRAAQLSAGGVDPLAFALADLDRIAASMARAATEAGVPIVTGDTKVVERGKGDGVFITTTGVGVVPDGVQISGDLARPGDAILVNGSMGDHGVAIMSSRENLAFETAIESDSAALHTLVAAMVETAPAIRCLRMKMEIEPGFETFLSGWLGQNTGH